MTSTSLSKRMIQNLSIYDESSDISTNFKLFLLKSSIQNSDMGVLTSPPIKFQDLSRQIFHFDPELRCIIILTSPLISNFSPQIYPAFRYGSFDISTNFKFLSPNFLFRLYSHVRVLTSPLISSSLTSLFI
jgi:hypothetical protein